MNLPLVVFTDSRYALGVLAKGWKAKENLSLIQHIKALIAKFQKLSIVKIKGHAGHRRKGAGGSIGGGGCTKQKHINPYHLRAAQGSGRAGKLPAVGRLGVFNSTIGD